MKKKNSKKSSKQLIAVLAIFATFSVLFAGSQESKISFRQTDFVALPEMTDQGLALPLAEQVAGEQIVTEQPIYGNGSQVEQPALQNVTPIPFDFQLSGVAFTANGVPMEGNLQDGFVLYTDRNANTDYSIRFNETITPDPQLLDTPYPLYLTSADLLPATTASATFQLQNYYNQRNIPAPFLNYLLNALPGSANQNAFAFITREQPADDVYVFLADGAKTTILSADQQYSMTIPGDFPLGTYYINGPEAVDRVSLKLIIRSNYCGALTQNIKNVQGVKLNMQNGTYDAAFDLNHDDAINIADFAMAVQAQPLANINGDDAVDLRDIALLAQICAGQSVNLPAVVNDLEFPVTPVTPANISGGSYRAGNLIVTPKVEIVPEVLGEKLSNCKIDQDVVGQTKWADGTLIRGCDNKVYRIENQVKRHISSLKDLFKYIGQRIYNVTDEIVALF
jgi:hypothetical protein